MTAGAGGSLRDMAGAIAVPLAVAVAAAAGVALIQPRLAASVHAVKERDDIVAFPPPEQLRALVLGWDAAAVDLLWSSLLVEYGEHFAERRDFKEIPRYIDAILALEPSYAPLYRYVDTMLAYRPMQGTEADVVLARKYLERGMKERPQDSRVYMKFGQFCAFIAPSFLSSEAARKEWRRAGAEAIARAVELGEDADEALAASAMLSEAGEKREAVRYLENAYAFTEHPSMREVHDAIGRRLASLEESTERDAEKDALQAVTDRWSREMPTVTRDRYLLLGPGLDAAKCAGVAAMGAPGCERGWGDATATPGLSAGSP